MKPKIAVLASGGGTTVDAFIRADQRHEIKVVVDLIICSRQNAGVFQRIAVINQEFGLDIPCVLINHKTHPPSKDEELIRGRQTAAEEQAILTILKNGNYDLIALMGYMRRLGPNLIKAYGWLPSYTSVFQAKMVNTHPGLLPDTKGFFGTEIQAYVLEHHLPYGGQTLHVVSEHYDEGPIIAEHKVAVEPDDTPDSLFARVQATEKRYLPKDIENFINARQAYNLSERGGR
jgi:phosphoribosylglycinamide formyltransferase-1